MSGSSSQEPCRFRKPIPWCLVALLVTLVLAGCGSTAGPTGGSPGGSSPRLVWSDEFSGPAGSAPSPGSWNQVAGGGGWGNQEMECYTTDRSNSALDGRGDLVISARRAPRHRCGSTTNDYTSARLTTQGLHAFTYGTFSVRARMPTGAGIWPAFWALGANCDTVGWPSCGEIDMTEVIGSDGSVSHASVHGPGAGSAPYSFTGRYRATKDLSTGFHVYAVHWTPTALTFSVDSRSVYSVTKATVLRSGGGWVFDHPFFLLLNVAVGGTWPGPPSDRTAWPQQMVVDYVRVYQDG